MKQLTLVIPVRNEEETILPTLTRLQKSVQTPYTVLIVDDTVDPTDKTLEIVTNYAKNHRYIQVLKKRKGDPHGFSAALSRGIKEVKTEHLVFVMADMCDSPETIDLMHQKITRGKYDLICASRYSRGGNKIGGPKLQSFISAIFNLSLAYFLNLPTKDITNSFKMYRRDTLDRLIIPTGSGFEVSTDLALRAIFSGAKVAEVPTTWYGRTRGVSKFSLLQRGPQYLILYLRSLARILFI